MSRTRDALSQFQEVQDGLGRASSLDDLLRKLDEEDALVKATSSSNLPARLDDIRNLPTPLVVSLHKTRERVEEVRQALREINPRRKCENCSSFKQVTQVKARNGGYDVYETHHRMCAHPAYSDFRKDVTRGTIEFSPQFTCEVARGGETLCGPEGRLWTDARGTVASRVGAALWEEKWSVLSWMVLLMILFVMLW